ncbi:MAG: glycosyltransferase family 39 protein [Candidatus Freyarchaeum deiterrae]
MLGTLRSKIDWAIIIIIVVNGIRGVLSAFPISLSWDEAVYSNMASDFYYFGFYCWQPFQVLLDFSRVPVLYFSIYLAYLITTPSVIVAQEVSFLISIGGVYAVYLLGKEMYSSTVGKFSALALSCGVTFIVICWGILSEVPFILISALFLLFIVRAQKNPKYYVPAGIFLTLSFLSRYPGGSVLFVGLFYIFFSKNAKKTFKSPWFYLGIICAFLTLFPWLFYSEIVTGDWLGMLKLFFASTQTYIRTIYTNPFVPPTLLDFVSFYSESALYAVLPIFTPSLLFPYFYFTLKSKKSVADKTLIFWILSSMLLYFILMSNSRLVDLFRYNQSSLPAFSVLTGLGLTMLLTDEYKERSQAIKSRSKNIFMKSKKLAILLVIINISVGFMGVYFVRTNSEVYNPIPVYDYLKYTTPPWQLIITNVYPMVRIYTDRLCVFTPNFPEWMDGWAKSGYVRAVFISLYDYVPIPILSDLESNPLYYKELVIPDYRTGLPTMIVYGINSSI